MRSLTNWRSHQARSPLQIAMTGKQTPPSSQHCPWKLCQGHSRMISCSSQQPTRQGQRNQCCWACSNTGECRVGCLSHGCSGSLLFMPQGQRLDQQLSYLGTMKHEVRIWFYLESLQAKSALLWRSDCNRIVVIQYCITVVVQYNTEYKLGTSARNLTLSLVVGPIHFFKALTCVFPKGRSFWQLYGSVRL